MLVEQKQTNKQLFLPFLSPQPNPESLYYLLLHLCFNNQLPHSVSLHEAAATKHMLVLSVIQIQKRKARHNSLTAWPKDSGRMPQINCQPNVPPSQCLINKATQPFLIGHFIGSPIREDNIRHIDQEHDGVLSFYCPLKNYKTRNVFSCGRFWSIP